MKEILEELKEKYNKLRNSDKDPQIVSWFTGRDDNIIYVYDNGKKVSLPLLELFVESLENKGE